MDRGRILEDLRKTTIIDKKSVRKSHNFKESMSGRPSVKTKAGSSRIAWERKMVISGGQHSTPEAKIDHRLVDISSLVGIGHVTSAHFPNTALTPFGQKQH